MRLEDECARVGGEEFAVLLPHTNLDGAVLVAERIRSVVEMSPVEVDDGKEKKHLSLTVSIGVAEVDQSARRGKTPTAISTFSKQSPPQNGTLSCSSSA